LNIYSSLGGGEGEGEVGYVGCVGPHVEEVGAAEAAGAAGAAGVAGVAGVAGGAQYGYASGAVDYSNGAGTDRGDGVVYADVSRDGTGAWQPAWTVEDMEAALADVRRGLQEGKHELADPLVAGNVLHFHVARGDVDAARGLVGEWQRFNFAVDQFAFNTLLQQTAQNRNITRAHLLLQTMRVLGIVMGRVTYNILVYTHVSCGDVAGARAVMDTMKGAGVSPDVITYTSLLQAFVAQGEAELASGVVEDMRRDGVHPDSVTFNSLLQVYVLLFLRLVLASRSCVPFRPAPCVSASLSFCPVATCPR
jgi:pentatricopeptide repeat protein